VVICRSVRVVDGEDAVGWFVLVLSSRTFPGARYGVGRGSQVLPGRFVGTVSLDLQLINEGFRLQHRLPQTPVECRGRGSCDARRDRELFAVLDQAVVPRCCDGCGSSFRALGSARRRAVGERDGRRRLVVPRLRCHARTAHRFCQAARQPGSGS
jgi:hypothetical protein